MTNSMFDIFSSLFAILLGVIVLATRSSWDKKMIDTQTGTKDSFFTKFQREHVKHIGEKGVRRESLIIGIVLIAFGVVSFFF